MSIVSVIRYAVAARNRRCDEEAVRKHQENDKYTKTHKKETGYCAIYGNSHSKSNSDTPYNGARGRWG